MAKNIVKEEKKILYGRKYIKNTYDDNSITFKRFNDKTKMWVTLKFQPEGFDEESVIKRGGEIMGNLLFNSMK